MAEPSITAGTAGPAQQALLGVLCCQTSPSLTRIPIGLLRAGNSVWQCAPLRQVELAAMSWRWRAR
jgi:hypothetical protein